MQPMMPPQDAPEADATTRAHCDAMAQRAGLRLNEQQRVLLYRAAPHALEIARRMPGDHGFGDEPANVFQFPRSAG